MMKPMARMWIGIVMALGCTIAHAQGWDLTAEQAQVAKEFLVNGIAERQAELDELQRRHPHQYIDELQRAWADRVEYESLRREEPDLFRIVEKERRLERRSYELARDLRQSTDPQQAAELAKQLEAVVGEHFDLREGWRAEEIQRLEHELELLRKEGELRRLHRQTIISRRVEELKGEAETYSW